MSSPQRSVKVGAATHTRLVQAPMPRARLERACGAWLPCSQQAHVCLRDLEAPAPQVCGTAIGERAHCRHLALAGGRASQAALVVVKQRVCRLNLSQCVRAGLCLFVRTDAAA